MSIDTTDIQKEYMPPLEFNGQRCRSVYELVNKIKTHLEAQQQADFSPPKAMTATQAANSAVSDEWMEVGRRSYEIVSRLFPGKTLVDAEQIVASHKVAWYHPAEEECIIAPRGRSEHIAKLRTDNLKLSAENASFRAQLDYITDAIARTSLDLADFYGDVTEKMRDYLIATNEGLKELGFMKRARG